MRSRDTEDIRFTLTCLCALRAISLERTPDLTPITNPLSGAFQHPIEEFIPEFWKEISADHIELPSFKRFHATTKAGPNGQALGCSLGDLLPLPDKLVGDIKLLGGNRLESIVDLYKSNPGLIPLLQTIFSPAMENRKFETYRKLSVVRDKEGKQRVIAIFDYWSQTALRPVHDWLFSILRTIKQDCTFNQSAFLMKIDMTGPFFSLDLTSATDRFPIWLQEKVLAFKLGPVKAKAWRDILCDHKFKNPYGDPVSYEAGQPMGAYSSWAAFTLTHHMVVKYCIATLKAPKDCYVMLGDDIVISNKDVAEMYKDVIHSLGVEISTSKSHESEHTFEFAKRWFHKGVEVTPFPLSGIEECIQRVHLLAPFLVDVNRRWGTLGDIPSILARMMGFYHKTGRLSRFKKKAHLFLTVQRMLNGSENEISGLRLIQDLFGLPVSGCGTRLNVLSLSVYQSIYTAFHLLKKTRSRPFGQAFHDFNR